MQPDQKRARLQSQTIARGKMFLKAELDWLPGFPMGQTSGAVAWMCIPQQGERKPRQVFIDRHHLHRATYLWYKMSRRFPRALPHLVKDVDHWTTGLPQILEWLKGAIHQNKKLPQSLINSEGCFSNSARKQSALLSRQHSTLHPLLDAMSWFHFLNPEEMLDALAWLKGNVSAIEVVLEQRPGVEGLVTAICLMELVRCDGNQHISPLLHFLGDRRAYTLRMPAKIELSFEDELSIQQPRQSQKSLGEALSAFIDWLNGQDQTKRRRAVKLMAQLLPLPLIDDWQNWWHKAHAFVTENKYATHAPVAKPPAQLQTIDSKPGTVEISILKTQWEALVRMAPPASNTDDLLQIVTGTANLSSAETYRAIVRALQYLPMVQQRALVRAAFLVCWLKFASLYPGRMIEVLSEFSAMLARHGSTTNILWPWQHYLAGWHIEDSFFTIDADYLIFRHIKDRKLLRKVFQAIAACARFSGNASTINEGACLVKLVEITDDVDMACACFCDLHNTGLGQNEPSWDLLRCAYTVDKGRGNFIRLVAILLKAQEEIDNWDELSAVVHELDAAGWMHVTGLLILDGQLRLVRHVGQRIVVLRKLDGQTAPPLFPDNCAAPQWARRYPAVLLQPLALLSQFDLNAESTAEKILAKDFPNPEKMEIEIAAIEKRLYANPGADGLGKRLAALRDRLGSSPITSRVRLTHLEEKVNRATHQALMNRWQLQLNVEFRQKMKKLLAVNNLPDWLTHEQNQQAIAALFSLAPSFRDLGLRLVRKRCGRPPWNLADDPANQAFIDRMRKLGVNMMPWLIPAAPRLFMSNNKRPVYLCIEKDPLEIFQMGGHFNTCLSPGAFNYFSAIANAADVNKCVVYARDEENKIVGRSLLALTNQGGLLVFEPYCHDGSLGFGNMISAFAIELAVRMGTTVLPEGEVPCLVAQQWYDDGPRDLCRRFGFLAENSSFRKSLAHIEPGEMVAALEKLFEPLPLNALTLPLIIDLKEMDDRPELLLPLLPVIEACQDLTDLQWLRVAQLARKAGAMEFAVGVAAKHVMAYLDKLNRRGYWLSLSALNFLVEVAPSMALPVLRRARRHGVRTDEDENDPELREYLARAHELLGRTLRAQRLRNVILSPQRKQ